MEQIKKQYSAPYSYEQLIALRAQEASEFARQCDQHREEARAKRALGRSGIQKKHQNCSLDNYQIRYESQEQMLDSAKGWLATQNESPSCSGFIFSGTPGTGKNHIASAIANDFIDNGKQAVVVTVSEIMMRLRDTYRKDSKETEERLMARLSGFDLLVIDEVGVQRNNVNEQLTLNSIVNDRSNACLPTGILTNLDANNLVETLGKRVIERVLEGGGPWLMFDWQSYRTGQQ
ncbi:ATP-binding protein [Shewanella surugensis]|uniref:ATP-binding protein n=1 Tax=Shewanella surugensis TaxID=212020 RepID=A0ABT0L950_9GAMM|nr:ATP-binding protein [Shewanella surugensis]MCL1124214.1 ATP-binding protein [Shewanella surugensis]